MHLTFYKYKERDYNKLIRVDGIPDSSMRFYALTKDLGEEINNTEINKYYFSTNGTEDRDDLDLISLVEELGEKANGDCAELKILEIPDDVEWEIKEYDGNEWVAEIHRTWR